MDKVKQLLKEEERLERKIGKAKKNKQEKIAKAKLKARDILERYEEETTKEIRNLRKKYKEKQRSFELREKKRHKKQLGKLEAAKTKKEELANTLVHSIIKDIVNS